MDFSKFTIAHWSLLMGAFTPFVATYLSKAGAFGKNIKDGGFDNNRPREWLAKQTGVRALANAAQQNTFEALPFFYASVLLALQMNVAGFYLNLLCLIWLFLRFVYIILYIKGVGNLRSTTWMAALTINIAIFLLGSWPK